MAQLSNLALTLLDYAETSAKRRSWERVTPAHLLEALLKWDTEWFNQECPEAKERLEEVLSGMTGGADRPGAVDVEVTELLQRVDSPESAKTILPELLADLAKRLEASEAEVRRNRAAAEATSEGSGSTGADTPQDDASDTDNGEGRELMLERTLLERIAALVGKPIRAVAAEVAQSARFVSRRVLKRDDDEVDAAVASAVGEAGSIEGGGEPLEMLKALVALDSPDSARAATQLALALVDVAEYAASLDAEVTNEEIAEIDAIRLECRAVLLDKIDTTSDAIMEFERQFSELVGMEAVKRDLRKRVDFMLVNRRRAQRGRETTTHRMHMSFVGNPGTGKTTVARLFATLLRKLDLLPSDTFIETDRSGLIGRYIGETETKTREVIARADGGVLFIDEAYALNDRYNEHKGFGEEAIDVLVKQMEDRRETLVVVFAGYQKPMEAFLSVNPGLRSRIPATIEFPDYSPGELLEIADRLAHRRGLRLDEAARRRIGEVLGAMKSREGFGNARDVENVMDVAQRNLVARVASLGNLATDEESSSIVAADIPLREEAEAQRQIGFARHMYL